MSSLFELCYLKKFTLVFSTMYSLHIDSYTYLSHRFHFTFLLLFPASRYICYLHFLSFPLLWSLYHAMRESEKYTENVTVCPAIPQVGMTTWVNPAARSTRKNILPKDTLQL